MNSIKNIIKILLTVSLVLCFTITQNSCARNVSDLTPSLDVKITLTFKTTIDSTKYNYYIALHPTKVPQIPNEDIPPETEYYFPTPGLKYNEFNSFIQTKEGINFYYKNFFKSWRWYMIYQNNELKLFDSDPNFNENTQADTHFEYFPNTSFVPEITKSNNQLIIKFNINNLTSTELSKLRLACFTSDQSDSENNIGHLIDLNEQNIESDLGIKLQGKEKLGPIDEIDTQEIINNDPADITQIEVEIF